MVELLPPWPLLTAFVAASLLLAVTPGPGVLYIVTRSVVHGRRSGLASVAGIALGNLCNAVGAVLGLAVLFSVSSTAFLLAKYAGAAYLIYLGLRALGIGRRAPGAQTAAHETAQPSTPRNVFRDGFVVALLNPKTTIFFAAFLPQFMSPGGSAFVQGLTLGSLFVAIAAVTDSIYAILAGGIAQRLRAASPLKRMGRYASAATLIGLGVFAALSDPPANAQRVQRLPG